MLAFCGLIGETAEHGDLTWDSIRLILMLSLPLGLIFAFLFFVIDKLSPPKVIIREKMIQYTAGQDQSVYPFKQYDYFEFGTWEEMLDERPIRYLILQNAKDDSHIAFEISREIDDSEIYNILIERLLPADVYFANRES